jgi:hypothetical protein
VSWKNDQMMQDFYLPSFFQKADGREGTLG